MGNAFKCDKCKYETNDKSKFRDHQIYVHTDVEKKFACEICNFRTAQKEVGIFRSIMLITMSSWLLQYDFNTIGVTILRVLLLNSVFFSKVPM